MSDNKPLTEIFAEGRKEVQEAERRVADARVQALEAQNELQMTRLGMAFEAMRRDLNAALDRIEATINAPAMKEEKGHGGR